MRKFIDAICKFFDSRSDALAKIAYIEGDATRPIGNGKKLIIHCCNDIGAWGAGFVLALSKRDKFPQDMYYKWHDGLRACSTGAFKLGEVQFVGFSEDRNLYVANMIGQHGCGIDDNHLPPIRYEAIRQCLRKVRKFCRRFNMSVHAPKFGADLAGGDWNIIEKIIEEELTSWGIPVTVYIWKRINL